MFDIAVVDPLPALPAVVQAEMDAARAFALAEKSEATRKAYKSDFRHFTAWCGERGASPMPASPELVAMYLAHLATSGVKASTIGRRAAALRYAHRLAGYKEPPTNSEQVRTVLRGIRREIGIARTQKAPATADLITRMIDLCPDTLLGLRDRAVLAIGFAAALRRSEVVAIRVEHLEWCADGVRLLIPRSKGDQEGEGQTVAIIRGCRLRPVAATEAWLEASGIADGPLFRPISKAGCVGAVGLSSHAVAEVVKQRARAAGLDPALFSGHSLRSGFATSAAEAGSNIFKIMEITRHKSVDTLRGYVRRADLFREHAGAAFL